MNTLTGLAVLLICVWISFLIRAVKHGMAIGNLGDEVTESLLDFPSLTIILSARDEAGTMKHALPKLLAVNYPNAEFILVNDRSTDRTGALIDAFAAKDPRVHVIHIEKLPAGWLGKVHALDQAVQHAEGKWLLFTDADIHFNEHALSKAIAFAEGRGLDHVTIIPESVQKKRPMLLSLFETAFGILGVQGCYAPNLADPSKSDFIGIGAFNLVRREAFDRTPGFSWLRMEVMDDIGIGLMLKKAGSRSAVCYGRGLLSLEWYTSVREMIKGLEKNSFALFARFNYIRLIAIVLMGVFVLLGPLVIALISWNLLLLGIVVLLYSVIPALSSIVTVRTRAWTKPGEMLLLPIGYLLLLYTIINSAFQVWKNKGIFWRDTFYPIEELRQMQRIKY